MNDTLKLRYHRFYTPLPMEKAHQKVETCHRQQTPKVLVKNVYIN